MTESCNCKSNCNSLHKTGLAISIATSKDLIRLIDGDIVVICRVLDSHALEVRCLAMASHISVRYALNSIPFMLEESSTEST